MVESSRLVSGITARAHGGLGRVLVREVHARREDRITFRVTRQDPVPLPFRVGGREGRTRARSPGDPTTSRRRLVRRGASVHRGPPRRSLGTCWPCYKTSVRPRRCDHRIDHLRSTRASRSVGVLLHKAGDEPTTSLRTEGVRDAPTTTARTSESTIAAPSTSTPKPPIDIHIVTDSPEALSNRVASSPVRIAGLDPRAIAALPTVSVATASRPTVPLIFVPPPTTTMPPTTTRAPTSPTTAAPTTTRQPGRDDDPTAADHGAAPIPDNDAHDNACTDDDSAAGHERGAIDNLTSVPAGLRD